MVAHRVVLDTNVWVSAIISPEGNSARLVRAVLTKKLSGIASGYILAEIDRAFSKKWFQVKAKANKKEIEEYLLLIRTNVEIVIPVNVLYQVRDPDDLPIIGTALAGQATHLVTGDRDILEDKQLIVWMRDHGVQITSPAKYRF